jgi:hypothetical protein
LDSAYLPTYLSTNQPLLVHIFTQISLDHFAKGEQDQTPRSRYLVTLDNLHKKWNCKKLKIKKKKKKGKGRAKNEVTCFTKYKDLV